MGDSRYIRPNGEAWQHTTSPMKIMIRGQELLPTANEAGWPDLPGSIWSATTTNGVVTQGTVSTGHLTAGLDRNHGLTGDYWYLDTQPGHDYRVEVKFGDNPNVRTGGSAGTDFYDRSEDHDFASSCCESDHNREDGATFFHFTHAENKWDRDYMVKVATYDHYNGSLSHTYTGPYKITLTDITSVQQMVHSFRGGRTRPATDLLEEGVDVDPVDFAMSFSTGAHTAGYTLDRIKVLFHSIGEPGATPAISLNAHTPNEPGNKLCDIAVPDGIAKSQVDLESNWALSHTFLAPGCENIILAANSTYWIVFSDTNRSDYIVALALNPDVTDSYGSGWRVVGSGKRGSGAWEAHDDALGRIGIWAKAK